MKIPAHQQVKINLQIEGDPFGGPANRALDDVGEHWWSGTFRQGVQVVLAAALAVGHQTQVAQSTVALQQDDPAGKLYGLTDEDALRPSRLVQIDPFIVRYIQPWGYGDSGTRLAGAYDDTHLRWDNPLKPVIRPFKPFDQGSNEQHEQATGLHGPDPDGDTRVSLLNLTERQLRYIQPWSFDSGSVQLAERDEGDGWWNQVRPIPFTLKYPQQWTFEQHDIGQPVGDDGDFVRVLALTERQLRYPEPFSFDNSQVRVTPAEEDFWSNPNRRVEQAFRRLDPAFDDHATIFLAADEDFPARILAKADGTFVYVQPWSFDSGSTLLGIHEEEFWQNPLRRLVWEIRYPQQWTFDEQVTFHSPPDSDEAHVHVLRVDGRNVRVEPWSLDSGSARLILQAAEDDSWTNAALIGFGYAQVEAIQRRLAIRTLTDNANEQVEPKPVQRRMYVTRMIEVLNLDAFPERG